MTTWMMPRVAALAAAMLLCASLLTAWLVPLFDPDEGFYPATAAESLDAGRGWDLRFDGQPRWDKPVLAYALIESAFTLLGRSDGAARVPSAIEGALLVLIVGGLVAALAGERAGGLSALVLSTTVGVQVYSRVAHPEIALALSIGTTQLLLVTWLLSGPKRANRYTLPLLIGISMGYGLLAKGPVAAVIPGIGALLCAPFVLERDRWPAAIRDGVVAGAVALALAAPWFVAMTLRHGTPFLREALWQQNVARYTGQLVTHPSASPVYYVVPTIVALLPWTALLVPALRRVRRPRGDDRREAARFCVAIMAAATFGFYSLSASKLASYIVDLMPSLAVVVGLYLDDALATGDERSSRVPYRATSIVLAAFAVTLLILPLANGRLLRTRDLTGGFPDAEVSAMLTRAVLPIAAAFAAGSMLVLALRARGRILALAAVGACVPIVAVLATRPLVVKAYPWERFAARIARDPAPIWLDGYRTPSLTFYTGRPIVRVAHDKDLNGVIAGGEGWVVVEARRTNMDPLRARLDAGRASIVDRAGDVLLVRLAGAAEAD